MPDRSKRLHVPFIKRRLPDWTQHLHSAHLEDMTDTRDLAQRFISVYPDLFDQASPMLRQRLLDSQARSNTSIQQLARTLKDFKGITEFCKPLLIEAMRKKFGQTPDVVKTHLYHLRTSSPVDAQPLLQAAMRNFEANESFDEVSLQETSALAPEGSLESERYDETDRYPFGKTRYLIRNKLSIKPADFAGLCRELDLGKHYQNHLRAVFQTPGTAAVVRQRTMTASKDRLRVQAHIARMKLDIDESVYVSLLAFLDGTGQARFDGKPMVFSRLSILGSTLSDVFIIGNDSRQARIELQNPWYNLIPGVWVAKGRLPPEPRFVVYIPGDPVNPLKTYASVSAFASELGVKLRHPPYQRLFASLVPHGESPGFLRRLKNQLTVYRWNPNPVYPGPPYNPETYANGVYEQVWNTEMNLALEESVIDGEVFGARYDFHLARIKSNAGLLARPTGVVDREAWIERLQHYAEWGMNLLNVAAFFVPGLGEMMMGVTAVQLGYEVFEGVEAWSAGDADEAWQHFKSVLQNVAYMAALGAVASKGPAVLPSRFVNSMSKVTTPFGKVRLWHPDLAAYKSSASLEGLTPNALGQYQLGGKTYIRMEGNVFEKTFDPEIKLWRIQHPTVHDTYQPILRHNGFGAWRHTLERPLGWNRVALMRRMGPHMEPFTDAQLEQIADVSGVNDDHLRGLHTDHQPPPPVLAETVRLFELDRQTDEVIRDIRQGACREGLCQFMVPLTLELPNWPVDEVLEVFSGPEPWGASQRFSAADAADTARPTIKITRAEVDAGKMPERVLENLDDGQIARLLGSENQQPDADRVQVFRDRLADHAQRRRKAVFDNLMSRQAAPDADTQILQRSFPTLSPEAARQVLSHASDEVLGQLRSTQRVPLRLATQIRVHLHESGVSRALIGLSVESLASSASDRLALHCLEHLPGWSADTRVEVRLHGVRGPLVDSIGGEQAATRYYLVKGGDFIQAFDAQGKALNSVPASGRNLFESLLEVVPAPVRESLQGKPSEALRKQVVDYALSHRDDMSRIIKRDPLKRGGGRLLRRPSGRVGYAASGDVAGFADEALVARVRAIYPNVTDQQALQFVRSRLSAGDTDQQVFHLLENRRREFEGLCSTLDTWVEGVLSPDPRGSIRTHLRGIADRIIDCWRNGLYRGLAPAFELDIASTLSVPRLAADFSHVRRLRLTSLQLAGSDLERMFPALKSLELNVIPLHIPMLADQLSSLQTLTELKLTFSAQGVGDSLALSQALQGMTQLERLHLVGNIPELDYSTLPRLRALTLAGPMDQWPTGVLALPALESLDLSGVAVQSLPNELFSGHEALWRRLQLNWGALEPEQFTRVFDYVHDNPGHLVEESQVIAHHCHQRLGALVPNHWRFAGDALAALRREGLEGRGLLDKVVALEQEHSALDGALEQWQATPVRVDGRPASVQGRRAWADRVRALWRDALVARYGGGEPEAGPSRLFDEPRRTDRWSLGDTSGLGDLPALGDVQFTQIRVLSLARANLSTAQANDLLLHFPNLEELDLSGNRLTDLPQALETQQRLTKVNLSGNELTITPSIQARLNRLTSLQGLDLAGNRLTGLSVNALMELQSLNVSRTQLRAWPEGVLDLSKLRFLDLSYSAITEVPNALWTDHDILLAHTSLRGCRLSPQAITAVQAFADRTAPGTPSAFLYRNPLGIDRPVLAAGRTGGDPEFFPEEVSEQPDLLVPLPVDVPGQLPLTSAERLQRLDPQLGAGQAVERLDAWLGQGMSATQIEDALRLWQEQQVQMIQGLNRWIDNPAVRSRDGWVNAPDRRRAAERLLACWRETLREVRSAEAVANDYVLDLSGLTVGDLPALPITFRHVGTLDLSNVGLTTASDAFLRAFPRLESLMLNGNDLGALPDAVTGLERLTRLSAHHNELSDAPLLQRQLRALPQLQQVDLETNHLDSFDVAGLDRLQVLNLNYNRLSDWPAGVLEAPALTTLGLRSNYNIETIPVGAFLPEHNALMAGTDLSDNMLEEREFLRLQEYQRETGRGLGFTPHDIDELLAGFHSEAEDDEPGLALHPENETPEQAKARWFTGGAADSERQAVWDTVMAQDARMVQEEGAPEGTPGDLATILGQLRHTRDFQLDRVNLTERVWNVLEAAYGDQALRERLLGIARASRHGATCGDGRILLFNALEVEVFEFNALRAIDPADKGRVLLKLSRKLFRLAQVEAQAEARIQQNPGIDPAEIRLAYRIGLAQRLELPTQPRSMLYNNLSRVMAADLDAAYTAIIAQEQTPAFIEQLTVRQYWVNYLQEKYPDKFSAVQQTLDDALSTLEDQYAEFNPAYFEALQALQKTNESARRKLLNELSTREIADLGD